MFQLVIDVPSGRVSIDGDLDLTADDQVSSAFEALEALGVRRIEADLAGVTFIDAHGLAGLRRIQRDLARSGGHLEVVAGSDRYVRTCRLARYDTLLPHRAAAAAGEPFSPVTPPSPRP
jgi:anti-anti-sigma factor